MNDLRNTKMVTRPGNLYKTPPGSRGTSPARSLNRSTRPSPVQSPNRTSRSPIRTTSKKIQSSPDRQRKTPEKILIRSRGNSPAKSRDSLSRSRGSDFGSIERLDDDNNLQRIITSYNQTEDNINVVVRVRPLNNREKKSGDTSVIQFPGNGQVLVDGIPGGPSGGQKPKLFSYNVVFEPAATQEDVLQFSGMKRLIEMALEGFRCTCFCYGQTGSGKTHTLTGPPGLFGVRPAPFSDKHGLVFRSFLYLFELIQQKTDVHFVLKASYLEIYNEKVIDLLNPGSARKPLAVRWSKKARGFFVENLFTVDCEELDDLIAVLEEGLRNRAIGKHNMNEFSSRSHTILTVYITSEEPAEGGVFLSRSGKINFVDLAGSEMTKKTQSEGKTLEEANNINKSLMVLGYCISSLSDSKRKNSHIPYRDSKLTKLLADSLAGNGVTLMIACISPARSNISETLNTLRYAARAKKIRTKPIVLMDPREALILSLKREVNVLQSENEHLRSALNVYSGSTAGDLPTERRVVVTPPHVDLEKLAELEGPQLAELVRLYMTENEALRRENSELYSSREILQRDHELVCRENERLLKKLEEVNSSPLIPARPAFSAELLNSIESESTTNIWSDGDKSSHSRSPQQIPQSIQKELDKRQIKTEIQTPRRGHRRNKSLEENSSDSKVVRVKSSESDGGPVLINRSGTFDSSSPERERKQAGRRFSVAKPDENESSQNGTRRKLEKNSHIFGSVISLTDEEDI
ncbi:kinesin-like protein KIF12 isoform X2 [Tribolium madens]|uniref:kinesin-like protein KIF12 isoform X2 n=1 Tax=Tribolium madens TaxID=41895 RepID=UPI001CF72A16|nr:kinesin-like protein KIF12 isoform X2 [Tribolium madens]